jgi:hypothetical protein
MATGAGLLHLAGLTALSDLRLRRTQAADAGLANLTELTGLTALSLGETKLTDAGLVHRKGLHRPAINDFGDESWGDYRSCTIIGMPPCGRSVTEAFSFIV